MGGKRKTVSPFRHGHGSVLKFPDSRIADDHEDRLKQAQKALHTGTKRSARDQFEALVELARQRGDAELLARAALGWGEARVWVDTGVVDHALVAALEEAIRRLPANQPGLRARLHARLAEERYDLSPDQRRVYIRAAISAAREAGDPAVNARVRLGRRFALWVPENLEHRCQESRRALKSALKARDWETAAFATTWLISDLLESGDVVQADLQIQAFAHLAQRWGGPVLKSHELRLRAQRAMMAGRFDEAERFAMEALQVGASVDDPDAPVLFAAQLFILRFIQGRLAEIEPATRSMNTYMPNISVGRVTMALVALQSGDTAKARCECDFMTVEEIEEMPRDAHWLMSLALLAEVCFRLNDPRRAVVLYDLLKPYEQRQIIVVPGLGSLGTVSHYLGLLALTLEQTAVAVRHFETALERSKAMKLLPQVAQAEHCLATAMRVEGRRDCAQTATALFRSAAATQKSLGMRYHLDLPKREVRSHHDSPTEPPFFFQAQDEWHIRWNGKTITLPPIRGIGMLAHLVRHPGCSFHVTELVTLVEAEGNSIDSDTSREELQDWRAYWGEIHRLSYEANKAKGRGDKAALKMFVRKLHARKKELDAKTGEVEKIRKRVQRNLSVALAKIAQENDALKVYLVRGLHHRNKGISFEPPSSAH